MIKLNSLLLAHQYLQSLFLAVQLKFSGKMCFKILFVFSDEVRIVYLVASFNWEISMINFHRVTRSDEIREKILYENRLNNRRFPGSLRKVVLISAICFEIYCFPFPAKLFDPPLCKTEIHSR